MSTNTMRRVNLTLLARSIPSRQRSRIRSTLCIRLSVSVKSRECKADHYKVHFDAKLKVRDTSDSVTKREVKPGAAKSPGKPGSGSLPNWNHSFLPHSDIIKELQNCDKQITPWCLRLLYKFPPGLTVNPKNSYGIVEYTLQAYVPSDLDLFFNNFSTKQVGQRPVLDSIDGGYLQQTLTGFIYNGESNLDLEYAMTLVYP